MCPAGILLSVPNEKQGPVMIQHAQSAERFAPEEDIFEAGKGSHEDESAPEFTPVSYHMEFDTQTEASSVYSDNATDNDLERSQSFTSVESLVKPANENDPSVPYRAIVAKIQAEVYPTWPQADTYGCELTPSNSGSKGSALSFEISNDASRRDSVLSVSRARPSTDSKSSDTSVSSLEQTLPTPKLYTEPRFERRGVVKAVRFQDTASGLACPFTELRSAEGTSPLLVGNSSTHLPTLPERAHTLLRMRRPGTFKYSLASRSTSALLTAPGYNWPNPSQTANQVQGQQPLMEIPRKRGWVKRMAQALTDRKEGGNVF